MVRIVAQATSGIDPKWVMMAPVSAVRKLWEKAGWKNDDVDLYELNEAFSVQALGVMRELGLNPEKVNVNGGAVAIGHPIGASGARVLVTLIYEMIRRDVSLFDYRREATACDSPARQCRGRSAKEPSPAGTARALESSYLEQLGFRNDTCECRILAQ